MEGVAIADLASRSERVVDGGRFGDLGSGLLMPSPLFSPKYEAVVAGSIGRSSGPGSYRRSGLRVGRWLDGQGAGHGADNNQCDVDMASSTMVHVPRERRGGWWGGRWGGVTCWRP